MLSLPTVPWTDDFRMFLRDTPRPSQACSRGHFGSFSRPPFDQVHAAELSAFQPRRLERFFDDRRAATGCTNASAACLGRLAMYGNTSEVPR
jgi:hypothetical protein